MVTITLHSITILLCRNLNVVHMFNETGFKFGWNHVWCSAIRLLYRIRGVEQKATSQRPPPPWCSLLAQWRFSAAGGPAGRCFVLLLQNHAVTWYFAFKIREHYVQEFTNLHSAACGFFVFKWILNTEPFKKNQLNWPGEPFLQEHVLLGLECKYCN